MLSAPTGCSPRDYCWMFDSAVVLEFVGFILLPLRNNQYFHQSTDLYFGCKNLVILELALLTWRNSRFNSTSIWSWQRQNCRKPRMTPLVRKTRRLVCL